jgi:hypothetical protein
MAVHRSCGRLPGPQPRRAWSRERTPRGDLMLELRYRCPLRRDSKYSAALFLEVGTFGRDPRRRFSCSRLATLASVIRDLAGADERPQRITFSATPRRDLRCWSLTPKTTV